MDVFSEHSVVEQRRSHFPAVPMSFVAFYTELRSFCALQVDVVYCLYNADAYRMDCHLTI